MDLSELFDSCLANDADAVEKELGRLRDLASTLERTSEAADDREMTLFPRQLLQAWRQWNAAVRLGPEAQLERVLHSARTRTDWYRRQFRSTPEEIAVPLAEFEPVSREDLAAQPGQFYNDHLAPDELRALHVTSGTTSRPLVVWIDGAMFYDICFALYADVVDQVPGLIDRIEPGKCSVAQITNHPLAWAAGTRMLPLKLSHYRRIKLLDDPRPTLRALVELDPAVVSGTPSMLLTYLDALGGSAGPIRPGALLVSGEKLHDDHRRTLEERFGCPCFDAFISSEGGAMALSEGTRTTRHFAIRPHAAMLEVLTQSGQIMEEGSGEFVVTNLLNHGMPFVRYRTGDFGELGIVERPDGRRRTVISRLFGRDLPGFDYEGRYVTAGDLDRAILGAGISRFHLLQESSRRFVLTCERPLPQDDEAAAVAALAEILPGADVATQTVDAIAPPGRKVVRYGSQVH